MHSRLEVGLPAAASDTLLALAAALGGAVVIALAFADSLGAGPRHREWRRRWAQRIAPLPARLAAQARAAIARAAGNAAPAARRMTRRTATSSRTRARANIVERIGSDSGATR